MSKLVPLSGRLVVEPLPPEQVTKGGIVLPTATQEREQKLIGVVLAVGPAGYIGDGRRREAEVKIGDHVFYGKYSGNDIDVDGVKFKVLNFEDVLCLVN